MGLDSLQGRRDKAKNGGYSGCYCGASVFRKSTDSERKHWCKVLWLEDLRKGSFSLRAFWV